MTDTDRVLWLQGLLDAAGIPTDGVCLSPLRVDCRPESTEEQRAEAAKILSSFNPMDETAYAAWKLARPRASGPKRIYENRAVLDRVLGPDGKPMHAHLYFPDQPHGTLVWTPVLELVLTGLKAGQLVLCLGGCTPSSKLFVKYFVVTAENGASAAILQKATGKTNRIQKLKPVPQAVLDDAAKHPGNWSVDTVYGSAMVRSHLVMTPDPLPRPSFVAARPPGRLIGLGSGRNQTEVLNLTPYDQPNRIQVVELPYDDAVMTLCISPASDDASKGDFMEAYGTSEEYALIQATVLG
jgi:hypothetical protein